MRTPEEPDGVSDLEGVELERVSAANILYAFTVAVSWRSYAWLKIQDTTCFGLSQFGSMQSFGWIILSRPPGYEGVGRKNNDIRVLLAVAVPPSEQLQEPGIEQTIVISTEYLQASCNTIAIVVMRLDK